MSSVAQRVGRNPLPEGTLAVGAGLVLAGVAVGACSSVIPYVCDQLAMSRLPRASFALMLALLPATATLIGVIVLVGALTFFPALLLGPIVQGLTGHLY